MKQDLKECSFVPRVNSKYAHHRNLDAASLGTTKQLQVKIFRGLQSGDESVSVRESFSARGNTAMGEHTVATPKRDLNSFLEN